MRLGLPYFTVVVTVVHGVDCIVVSVNKRRVHLGTRLRSDLIILFTGGVASF